MSVWWWVRHGPTHAKGFVGSTDMPADLSDTEALRRLSDFLPKNALVVSSDLCRASATADAITAGRQRLEHAKGIREIDFGDWETKTFKEVSASHPDLTKLFWTDPDSASPPGGESWKNVTQRVGNTVKEISQTHPDRDVIAVAHLGVIATQIQMAGRMKAKSALSFSIDNLSVTRLEFLDPHWRILGVNHCP